MQSPDLVVPRKQSGPVIGIGSKFSGEAALVYLQEKHRNACVLSYPPYLMVDGLELVNAVDFKPEFNQCLGSNADYILFLIATRYHANAAVFDKRNQELEIFEPYGDNPEISEAVYQEIANLISSSTGPVSLFKPTDYCPVDRGRKVGPQFYEQLLPSDPRGFCQAWSLWWLDYRMSNPQTDRAQLLARAMERFPKNSDAIRNYSALLTKQRDELLDRMTEWATAKGYKCDFPESVLRHWQTIVQNERDPALRQEAQDIYNRLKRLNSSDAVDFKWLVNTALGQADRFGDQNDAISKVISDINFEMTLCVTAFMHRYLEEISRPSGKMCERLNNLQVLDSAEDRLVGNLEEDGSVFTVYAWPKTDLSEEQSQLIENYQNYAKNQTPSMSLVTETQCTRVAQLPEGEYQVMFEQISDFNLKNAQLQEAQWRSILFQVVWTLFIFSKIRLQINDLKPETVQLFNGENAATFVPDPSQKQWYTVPLSPLAEIASWAWSSVVYPLLSGDPSCAQNNDCLESARRNLKQLCQALSTEDNVDKAFLQRVIANSDPETVLEDPYFQQFRNQPIQPKVYGPWENPTEWLANNPQEAEMSEQTPQDEPEPELEEPEPEEPEPEPELEEPEPEEPEPELKEPEPQLRRPIQVGAEPQPKLRSSRGCRSNVEPQPKLAYKFPGRKPGEFRNKEQKAECSLRKIYKNRYNIKQLRQIACRRKIPGAFHMGYIPLCEALGFEYEDKN